MNELWSDLDERERSVFWMTADFIEGRLCEKSTLAWAIGLSGEIEREAERRAVTYRLRDHLAPPLKEPWRTAWDLVEASWSGHEHPDNQHVEAAAIRSRIEQGDRSRQLMGSIIDLVEPRAEVQQATWWSGKRHGRPKDVRDLVDASFQSCDVVHPDELGLSNVNDTTFLLDLANALTASLRRGISLGRSMGWEDDELLAWAGPLRVEWAQDTGSLYEADATSIGMAPVVKLLFAVTVMIADLAPRKVATFLRMWRESELPIDLRLWAALAARPALVSPEDVAFFLEEVDDEKFWQLHPYPEVTSLRARRFGAMAPAARKRIVRRIRRLPPKRHWPRDTPPEALRGYREFWAARELQRIVVCGGSLPAQDESWLEARLVRFEDLASMVADEGFPRGVQIGTRRLVEPDGVYDQLDGDTRLRALEEMLGTTGEESPGREWLRQPNSLSRVISELDAAAKPIEYPRLLDEILRSHHPTEGDDRDGEAAAMLGVLVKLRPQEVQKIGEGVAEWMDRWDRTVVNHAGWTEVWLRLWPAVVEATNAIYRPEDRGQLNVVAQSADDEEEPRDLDTLHTPVASLINVFVAACPSLTRGGDNPFDGNALGRVRDTLVTCEGQALLIVRHRLVRHLEWFLQADRPWAETHLIAPLLSDEAGRLALWRSVAERQLRRSALEEIGGEEVAKAATNPELGRRTRKGLVFSLVVDSLFAFLYKREPAVEAIRVQQVLRLVEDEIRGDAADTIVKFVRDVSRAKEIPRAVLFERAVEPFLKSIWPQERSLATPGVSWALATLPAASGDRFAAAVEAVKRFLVPCACHSMGAYGFSQHVEGLPKLDFVDDEHKAQALLTLLDLTVGTATHAAVPYDLCDALDQIRSVREDLSKHATFRRLSSLT